MNGEPGRFLRLPATLEEEVVRGVIPAALRWF
jgi:hypothetical protein